MEKIKLLQGDCLELMKSIPDGSVDAIITDPPFGTTQCSWDSIIPFDLMWEQLNRIIKPNGAIVLFGAEPFSSLLRVSNLKMYKYDWIWEKSKSQHFAQAPYRPMTSHESISVFSKGGTAKNANIRMFYNPQGLEDCYKECKGKSATHSEHRQRKTNQKDYIQTKTNYPKTIIRINNEGNTVHPTQKPVALMEYLVKTYTNENETILDFTMGSGSTGVACINTKRKFIGIEMDDKYFELAKKRIDGAIIKKQSELF
jgi:site-specific DNA-methyltransferase (adenine-specific)